MLICMTLLFLLQSEVFAVESVNSSTPATIKVTGRVSLPDGEKAPAGGVEFKIYAFESKNLLSFIKMIIPEGQYLALHKSYIPENQKYRLV